MKSIKNILLSGLLAATALFGGQSCVSDLDTMPLDDNSLVGPVVYATREGYIGVLAKCYAALILTAAA